jgi:hypothetical protein
MAPIIPTITFPTPPIVSPIVPVSELKEKFGKIAFLVTIYSTIIVESIEIIIIIKEIAK